MDRIDRSHQCTRLRLFIEIQKHSRLMADPGGLPENGLERKRCIRDP